MFEMTPSVIDARLCPSSHRSLSSHQHVSEFRRIDSAALFTRTVNSSTVLTGVSYTICFKRPYRKKSQGFKSGERAGHKTGPLRPIHRFSKLASNQFLTPRAL
jgi:hypothetical protein